MTTLAATGETALSALERKRVLDFVWVVTLAVELCAIALLGWIGVAEHGAAIASRSVFLYGGVFVLAADLSYRLRTPLAIELSVCGSQAAGILFLVYLWTLAGGFASPAALLFFAPPLFVSGLVGISWLPAATAALALFGTWTVAGLAPWHAFASASSGIDAQSARLLVLWSAGVVGLAAGSNAFAAALARLSQRTAPAAASPKEDDAAFGGVLRGAHEPMAVLYADTLQLAYASDSFYQRMLLDPGQVKGRSLYNLIRFANRERLEAQLERESGIVSFQPIEIGPEPIIANLRFFHTEHAGTRYLHVTFEEVTDLFHFQQTLDAIDDAVLIAAETGELLYANRAAKALFGDLYVGKPMLSLLHSHRLVSSAGIAAAQHRDRVVIGEAAYHQVVVAPRVGASGQGARLFWLRRFDEDEVRLDRASRDSLTGVKNRRTFDRDLRREIYEATQATPLALALWSLDRWKESCDQFGTEVGEQLLRGFASALCEQIRPGDGLYRLDGDTFAMVFPGADLAGAETAVQRLLLALDGQSVAHGGESYVLSASAGVTVARPREAMSSLVARADEALWAAKDGGGACCVARDPDAR